MKIKLTQEIVRELLDYNPDTGLFFWKKRSPKWFNCGKINPKSKALWWNNQHEGARALQFPDKSRGGYLRGAILGHKYCAHQIAFLYMTGDWPKVVDHINGIRDDNRWCNLRNGTYGENAKNAKLRKDNKTGFAGIYFSRSENKLKVYIRSENKQIHLKTTACIGEAIRIRRQAEIEHGFHPNHGRRIEDKK